MTVGQLLAQDAVIANGRFYPNDLLESAVARYRAYYDGWLFDRLTMLVFPFFAESSEQ